MSSAVDTAAGAVGLGNPANGAPVVTPPDRNNFVTPNADQINNAIAALGQNVQGVPDTGQKQIAGQQQQMLGQVQGQMQGGKSAAEMGAQTDMQNAGTQSMGALGSAAAGANPLEAVREQQQAQAAGQSQAIAKGAQGRAQEEAHLQDTATNLLGQLQSGSIAGASQRLQADVLQKNLLAQQVQARLELAGQQLKGSMAYSEMATRFAQQQRSEYIETRRVAQQNMQHFWGAILQTAGTVAAAGISSGMAGASPTAQDATNASQMANQGYVGKAAGGIDMSNPISANYSNDASSGDAGDQNA